jgi:phosphonate transport system permease protein
LRPPIHFFFALEARPMKNILQTTNNFFKKIGRGFQSAYYFVFGDGRGVTQYKNLDEAFFHRPRHWIMNVTLVAVLVLLITLMNNRILFWDFFTRPTNWDSIGVNIRQFFSINPEYLFGYGYYTWNESVIYQCVITFSLAFIGTLMGFILAIPFGFLASHKLFKKYAYITEFVLIFIRTIPEFLMAIILINLSGKTSVTGILCLGLHSIGMIGKLFSDQVDQEDFEPLEALDACGSNSFQRISLGVVPQVLPNFLSVGLYRLDINVRTATTLGIVLGSDAGIGFALSNDSHGASLTPLGTDCFGIVILVILVDLFSSWIRKKLV